MTPDARIRLDEARERLRKLEDAIIRVRSERANVAPHVLAAYIRPIVEDAIALRHEIENEVGLERVPPEGASAWLRLRGGRVGADRAPAQVVGRVIGGLQTGVRQLGAFLETGHAWLTSVPKSIRDEIAFDVIAFAPGSFRIAIAPEQPQLRVDHPVPLAEVALGLFVQVALWAESDMTDADLETLLPSQQLRRQILFTLKEIAPQMDAADFESAELTGPVPARIVDRSIRLTVRTSRRVAEYLRRRDREEVTYRGQLVSLDVERALFDLRMGKYRVHCRFELRMFEVARELLKQFVQVTGEGTFSPDREVPDIIAVGEIRPLTLEERKAIENGGSNEI